MCNWEEEEEEKIGKQREEAEKESGAMQDMDGADGGDDPFFGNGDDLKKNFFFSHSS
jgi:hypothetical protein